MPKPRLNVAGQRDAPWKNPSSAQEARWASRRPTASRWTSARAKSPPCSRNSSRRAPPAETATQLGYTKIYAPIDGIVSVRVAKQGEVVAQGSPIVVVVDVDHLWVRADVEESYIDSDSIRPERCGAASFREIQKGESVLQGRGKRFRHAARRQPHQARHQDLRHQSAVPNDGRRLFTGMTATVLLPAETTKAGSRGLWSPGKRWTRLKSTI
jgi:HlyD family secretion protein